MTGWTTVAVLTGLMVVALVGFNVHLHRRLKQATEAARAEAEREARGG